MLEIGKYIILDNGQPVLVASPADDLLMLAAIIVCGLGYAEGAKLLRKQAGWQVICWALVLSLPIMVGVSISYWPSGVTRVTPATLAVTLAVILCVYATRRFGK